MHIKIKIIIIYKRCMLLTMAPSSSYFVIFVFGFFNSSCPFMPRGMRGMRNEGSFQASQVLEFQCMSRWAMGVLLWVLITMANAQLFLSCCGEWGNVVTTTYCPCKFQRCPGHEEKNGYTASDEWFLVQDISNNSKMNSVWTW